MKLNLRMKELDKSKCNFPIRSRNHVESSHFNYISRFQGNEKSSIKGAGNDYSVKTRFTERRLFRVIRPRISLHPWSWLLLSLPALNYLNNVIYRSAE